MWGNKNLIGEGSKEREAYEMETEMDNSFGLYSKSSYYVSGVEWCTVLGNNKSVSNLTDCRGGSIII